MIQSIHDRRNVAVAGASRLVVVIFVKSLPDIARYRQAPEDVAGPWPATGSCPSVEVWIDAKSSLHPIHSQTDGLEGWLELEVQAAAGAST